MRESLNYGNCVFAGGKLYDGGGVDGVGEVVSEFVESGGGELTLS